MTHEMKLNDGPFNKIVSGTKKIEMRLYDDKRRKIKVGDNIIFRNRTTGEEINTKVLNLYIVPSFDKLYEMFNKVLLGYEKHEVALPSDMEQYYSKDEIEKYGVIGIEIKLI